MAQPNAIDGELSRLLIMFELTSSKNAGLLPVVIVGLAARIDHQKKTQPNIHNIYVWECEGQKKAIVDLGIPRTFAVWKWVQKNTE